MFRSARVQSVSSNWQALGGSSVDPPLRSGAFLSPTVLALEICRDYRVVRLVWAGNVAGGNDLGCAEDVFFLIVKENVCAQCLWGVRPRNALRRLAFPNLAA